MNKSSLILKRKHPSDYFFSRSSSKVTFFIIFLLLAMHSYSQTYWSMETCIQYAYENNIDIKKQSLLINSAEKDLLQSKASFLPDLNGYVTHSYNYGQTVDRYTNQFATDRVQSNNFNIQSNVVLFNGFQILNNYKQSKLGLMAAKYDVDKLKDDISLSIANAYLAILYSEELINVAESQLDITKQQVENTKKLVEAGTLARGSLLEIQAQQAMEELNVVQTQNQLVLAYLNLTQLLDLPSPKDFRIEKPEILLSEDDLLLSNPEIIFAYAVENQPDVKSAALRVESSEKGLDIARGASYPSLTFSGSWATGYSGASKDLINYSLSPDMYPIGITQSTFPDTVLGFSYDSEYKVKSFENQFRDNNNRTLGLYINIPIFNKLQTRTSISKSKIALESANYDLLLTKNQLRKNIQQAWADAKASHNSYMSTQTALEAAEESFKYIEQKFNVGMVNIVEYNDIKNKMIKGQSDLVRAKYEYIFRVKVMDFYLGRPITLK